MVLSQQLSDSISVASAKVKYPELFRPFHFDLPESNCDIMPACVATSFPHVKHDVYKREYIRNKQRTVTSYPETPSPSESPDRLRKTLTSDLTSQEHKMANIDETRKYFDSGDSTAILQRMYAVFGSAEVAEGNLTKLDRSVNAQIPKTLLEKRFYSSPVTTNNQPQDEKNSDKFMRKEGSPSAREPCYFNRGFSSGRNSLDYNFHKRRSLNLFPERVVFQTLPESPVQKDNENIGRLPAKEKISTLPVVQTAEKKQARNEEKSLYKHQSFKASRDWEVDELLSYPIDKMCGRDERERSPKRRRRSSPSTERNKTSFNFDKRNSSEFNTHQKLYGNDPTAQNIFGEKERHDSGEKDIHYSREKEAAFKRNPKRSYSSCSDSNESAFKPVVDERYYKSPSLERDLKRARYSSSDSNHSPPTTFYPNNMTEIYKRNSSAYSCMNPLLYQHALSTFGLPNNNRLPFGLNSSSLSNLQRSPLNPLGMVSNPCLANPYLFYEMMNQVNASRMSSYFSPSHLSSFPNPSFSLEQLQAIQAHLLPSPYSKLAAFSNLRIFPPVAALSAAQNSTNQPFHGSSDRATADDYKIQHRSQSGAKEENFSKTRSNEPNRVHSKPGESPCQVPDNASDFSTLSNKRSLAREKHPTVVCKKNNSITDHSPPASAALKADSNLGLKSSSGFHIASGNSSILKRKSESGNTVRPKVHKNKKSLEETQPINDVQDEEDNSTISGESSDVVGSPTSEKSAGFKTLTRERRLVANARERTRVHTISSAFDELRRQIPSYSCNQKLSKLAVLRIACSYIRTLSVLSGRDESTTFSQGVDQCTKVLQSECRTKSRKKDSKSQIELEMVNYINSKEHSSVDCDDDMHDNKLSIEEDSASHVTKSQEQSHPSDVDPSPIVKEPTKLRRSSPVMQDDEDFTESSDDIVDVESLGDSSDSLGDIWNRFLKRDVTLKDVGTSSLNDVNDKTESCSGA